MANPLTKEEFYAQHSAYFQQIGFDVQFAGGIYYLFSLGETDRLEYETKDDFVIYRMLKGKQIVEYYQVKHTKEEDKNMTDADSDFWKSVENWLKAYELSNPEEKRNYFKDARFIILTNKIPNNFLNSLASQLKEGSIELSNIKTEISDKLKANPGISYKVVAEKLLQLGDLPMRQFLMNLEIRYFEDFIKDMYDHFLQTYFNAVRSDQIVRNVVGDLWIYKQTCSGKFSFTGREFRQKYKTFLDQVSLKDDDLTMDGYEEDISIPNDFADLMLVKQLAMIDAIEIPPSAEDLDLTDYLTKFYQFRNAKQGFEKIQLLTPEREKKINKEAFDKYNNLFKTHQDSIIQKDRRGKILGKDEQKVAGRNTFYAVMDTILEVSRLKIDRGFSNGWFLSMSNEETPLVAWHYALYKQYIRNK